MTCFKVLKFSKILFNCAGFKTICQIHPEIVNCFDPSKDTVFWWKNNSSGKTKTNKKPYSSSILKLCKSLKKQVLLSLLQSSLGPLSDTLLPSQLSFFRTKGQRHPPPVLCTFWEGQRWNLLPNHTLHQWSSLHSGLDSRSPHLSERLTENSWLAFLATNHNGIYSPCRELWNQLLDWQAPQLKTHYLEISGLNISSSFWRPATKQPLGQWKIILHWDTALGCVKRCSAHVAEQAGSFAVISIATARGVWRWDMHMNRESIKY